MSYAIHLNDDENFQTCWLKIARNLVHLLVLITRPCSNQINRTLHVDFFFLKKTNFKLHKNLFDSLQIEIIEKCENNLNEKKTDSLRTLLDVEVAFLATKNVIQLLESLKLNFLSLSTLFPQVYFSLSHLKCGIITAVGS